MVKGLRRGVALIPCVVCGEPFFAWSLTAKYCPECRLVVMRCQQASIYYHESGHPEDMFKNKWFKRLEYRRSLHGSV